MIFLWILTSFFNAQKSKKREKMHSLYSWRRRLFVHISRALAFPIHMHTLPKCTLVARYSFYYCAFCLLLLMDAFCSDACLCFAVYAFIFRPFHSFSTSITFSSRTLQLFQWIRSFAFPNEHNFFLLQKQYPTKWPHILPFGWYQHFIYGF